RVGVRRSGRETPRGHGPSAQAPRCSPQRVGCAEHPRADDIAMPARPASNPLATPIAAFMERYGARNPAGARLHELAWIRTNPTFATAIVASRSTTVG